MNFKIKNFGKIAEADIKLDGITVICGDNNTGKSTVGKALFAFFNSLNDYKNKIDEQKNNKLRTTIRNYLAHYTDLPLRLLFSDSTMEFIAEHGDHFPLEDVKEYLESVYELKLPKDRLMSLVEYLNTPEIDILNESVHRYITSVMNGQVKNAYSSSNSQCYISGEFKREFINTIKIRKNYCSCDIDVPIEHSAYYINNPFSLDNLNEHRMSLRGSNPMSRNVVDAILQAQEEINEDSMTNILDTVLNKKELADVRKIIKKVYSGDTVIDHGRYFYIENGVPFDFRNISTGLKSFALIERMLETGVLKKKDVLILDEPEIHLHSEWQIYYAKLIVALQKTFDLNILIVTHSFQFLEALNFFIKDYKIEKCSNFYTPEIKDNVAYIKEINDGYEKLLQNLSKGTFKMADMEYEYEMKKANSDLEN